MKANEIKIGDLIDGQHRVASVRYRQWNVSILTTEGEELQYGIHEDLNVEPPEVEDLDNIFACIVESLDTGDPEIVHYNADDALCELLERLGMVKTVRKFEGLKKWYA